MPGVLPGGCRVLVSDRAHGDLRGVGAVAAKRQRALVDLPWTSPRQVHGRQVLVLEQAGAAVTPAPADAVVTAEAGRAIAVLGADCALVGLASPEGVIGVAHAGWRGLLAGVLEATVETMRALGASELTAVLGPCIHAECYAFGAGDLAALEARLGPSVRARTSAGALALDLPASVLAALAAGGIAPPEPLGGCTACDDRWFSHRARAEEGRHALVLWKEPA